MSTTQQLTPTEQKVLDVLPASAEEISSEFGTTRSTARDHIGSIGTKVTLDFERGDNGEKIYEHVPSREAEREANPDQNRSKQAITKEATQHVLGLEERMDSLLKGSSSPDVGGLANKDGREDVAIHRTDDHIGDVVKNEFGEEIFNTEIAKERIRKVTEKTLYLVDRQKAAGYEFDTAHLILGGDIVTGENIYEGQAHNIELTIDKQIDVAVELYLEQIRGLADRFDTLQIVCQLGNHGEMRGAGLSKEANADRIVYMMLDKILRESGYDNIRFVRNDSTTFTNFKMRGHNAHLRHGHNTRPHIGTSSTKKNWRGWKLAHHFDVAYWGHYHSAEFDEVYGAPVLRSGSIKPGDDFEEGIAESSKTGATLHGVSDDRPVTWMFPVEFSDE